MMTFDLEHLSMAEFSDWLHSANAGDCTVYAMGELARTIELFEGTNQIYEAKQIRELAWQASLARKICLTQQRKRKNYFAYLATKRANGAHK